MKRPHAKEYPEVFGMYISKVKGSDGLKLLEGQILRVQKEFSLIHADRETLPYAPDKWTPRQLVGHLCDTERIFGYRALCIARGDKHTLPGFDENEFVAAASFNERSLYNLLHEFSLVRESNTALFRTLSDAELDRRGMANNYLISARAIAYAMVGHVNHHLEILRERYLTFKS